MRRESFYYIMFADDKNNNNYNSASKCQQKGSQYFPIYFNRYQCQTRVEKHQSATTNKRFFLMCSFIWQQCNLIVFVLFYFLFFPLQKTLESSNRRICGLKIGIFPTVIYDDTLWLYCVCVGSTNNNEIIIIDFIEENHLNDKWQ